MEETYKYNENKLAARVAIYYNNKKVPKEKQEEKILELCSTFGKIDNIHKAASKYENLFFVQFFDKK